MKRKTIYITLAVCAFFALTACGEKQVDYNVTETPGGAEITEAADNPQAIESEIPETLTYDLEGKMAYINVNATVKLPDKYNQCSVVEFSKKPYEDADIKYYADKIFDPGSYFLFMPYSAEQIAYCRDKINDIISGSEDENFKAFLEEYYIFKLNYRETLLSGDEDIDGELKFYNVIANPYDESLEYTNMCQLMGTIDGVYYTLTFAKNDINYHMYLRRVGDYSTQEIGAESFDMKLTGNLCEYTQEEAENLAREYVDGLGYGELAVVKSINVSKQSVVYKYVDESSGGVISVKESDNVSSNVTLHVDGDIKGTEQIEGYKIYFGRKYGGYSLTYTADNYWGYGDYTGYGQYSTFEGNQDWFSITELNEFIGVYVDSQGICEVDIVNPLVEENVLTENAVLLDFEDMNEVAKNQLQIYADNFMNNFNIVELELGYTFVKEDGKLSLVPAWYLFDSNSGEDRQIYYRHANMSINALDGTVLYAY